ncbi:hypothetical protein EJ04DRAFT_558496 [Polyplosphaeria fusca]|uniref:C2H2-type domain-containing protein n=1 Tax=Polyplosphaeria fusca TaxID=682080 RepID=A0A9P4V984_9PLEO|nr:hypothetical protein EJ04DRAFT_558496 [Polyplosphaeria fusca]
MAKNKAAAFYCSLCPEKLRSRTELQEHMIGHEQVREARICSTCNFKFDDQLAMEKHQIISGHCPETGFECTRCKKSFPTEDVLAKHQMINGHYTETGFECAGCKKTFSTKDVLAKHRKFPSKCSDIFVKQDRDRDPDLPKDDYIGDLDYGAAPNQAVQHASGGVSLFTQEPLSTASGGGEYCIICKKTFWSPAAYNNHFLGCTPYKPFTPTLGSGFVAGEPKADASQAHLSPKTAETIVAKPKVQKENQPVIKKEDQPVVKKEDQPVVKKEEQLVIKEEEQPAIKKEYKSMTKEKQNELYMKVVTEVILPLKSSDESLKVKQPKSLEGPPKVEQPKSPEGPPKAEQQKSREVIDKIRSVRNLEQDSRRTLIAFPKLVEQERSRKEQAKKSNPLLVPSIAASPIVAPTLADAHQADTIQVQILRLVLQVNITIHEGGSFKYSDLAFARLTVERQSEVVGKLDDFCHLPEPLQKSEYVPYSKTFTDEHQLAYPTAEFTHSPQTGEVTSALKIIALSCSKVVLADGLQEVVKVAAVDVLSGRILMSNFVCTDPYVAVKDYRTTTTGISGYQDMEAARKEGYKVFKGWKAVKAALYRFVDNQTIIIGHNLRSDLDVLRMIHGRAIDVAKIVEKAAGGGKLSKQQLSLESLSRDLTKKSLTTHPTFGRDILLNAFAIRELALWFLKNASDLKRWASAKSADYQRLYGSG